MTFFDSIKTVFRKYAEFEGRATRPEFWWFALFSALVATALGSLNLSSTTSPVGFQWMPANSLDGLATTSSTLYLGASLAGAWGVVVLLPSLAAAIRRLRDAGRQWVEILWILLPIAGIIILVIRLAEPTKTDAIVLPSLAKPTDPPAPPAA